MGDLFTPFHLIIVLLVALLVFGPKRLPEIGQGLGRSIQEFRSAMNTGAESAGNAASGIGMQGMAGTTRGAPMDQGGASGAMDPVEIVDVPASSLRRGPS